jgi:SAM-dependent methyltransferase
MNENWDEIWNSLSEGMGSNPARKLRQDAILRRIQQGSILDFGAGDGEFVLRMRAMGLPSIGVEMSKEGVDKANSKANAQGYGDLLFELKPGVLNGKEFNNIVMSEVVEHIENPRPVLESLARNLSPGGIIIITVPAGPVSKFDRFIGHYRHYSKESLRAEIESAGFEVGRICQIGFPLINIVRIWCLIKGDKVTKALTKPNSLVDSFVGKLLIRILSSSFQLDSRFGWQLIATAKTKSLSTNYQNHS